MLSGFQLKSNSPSDLRSATWGPSESGAYFPPLLPGSKGIRGLAATSRPGKHLPISLPPLLYPEDLVGGGIC